MSYGFETCTQEELTALRGLARGEDVDHFPKDVISSLLDKNLLNDHAGFITVPAIVVHAWDEYQRTISNGNDNASDR